MVQKLSKSFNDFNIFPILHSQNSNVDLLANVTSKLVPLDTLYPNPFSVELMFRPSVTDNITNWWVIDDDVEMINFIHMEDTFKGSIIEKYQHQQVLSISIQEYQRQLENTFPKPMVKMEKFYDLQDKFKKTTNCKTNNSTMKFEVVNLGSRATQNINHGIFWTLVERASFTRLFKEYKDILVWTYDDLKTFDTKIIQHVILLKLEAKPFQQKLRRMHPVLKPTVKKELNKFLATKIIFPMRHTNGWPIWSQ